MAELISSPVFYYLQDQLERLNIKNYTINVTKADTNGRNIIATIIEVKIKENLKKPNQHNFVLKISPEDQNFRKLFGCSALFSREICFYTKILPEFENIQGNTSNPFDSYAKCYGVNTESNYETLMLEDMTSHGFMPHPVGEPLDYNHTLLTIKKYGELHALSYILRDLKPEVFQKLKECAVENYFTSQKSSGLEGTFIINSNKALEGLDPVDDKEAIEKYKRFIPNMRAIVSRSLQPESAGKYAVIGHGDCWANNCLYKYDPTDPKVPTEVCFVDWQFARIGSPALDLSYFLFSSTDKKLRDLYYDYFIEEYHKSLCSFFVRLGGKPENCLPYNTLQDHLRKFSVYGLYLGVQSLYLSLNQPKETNKNNPNEVMNFESSNIQRFHSRAGEVIRDFVRYGYDLH